MSTKQGARSVGPAVPLPPPLARSSGRGAVGVGGAGRAVWGAQQWFDVRPCPLALAFQPVPACWPGSLRVWRVRMRAHGRAGRGASWEIENLSAFAIAPIVERSAARESQAAAGSAAAKGRVMAILPALHARMEMHPQDAPTAGLVWKLNVLGHSGCRCPRSARAHVLPERRAPAKSSRRRQCSCVCIRGFPSVPPLFLWRLALGNRKHSRERVNL